MSWGVYVRYSTTTTGVTNHRTGCTGPQNRCILSIERRLFSSLSQLTPEMQGLAAQSAMALRSRGSPVDRRSLSLVRFAAYSAESTDIS